MFSSTEIRESNHGYLFNEIKFIHHNINEESVQTGLKILDRSLLGKLIQIILGKNYIISVKVLHLEKSYKDSTYKVSSYHLKKFLLEEAARSGQKDKNKWIQDRLQSIIRGIPIDLAIKDSFYTLSSKIIPFNAMNISGHTKKSGEALECSREENDSISRSIQLDELFNQKIDYAKSKKEIINLIARSLCLQQEKQLHKVKNLMFLLQEKRLHKLNNLVFLFKYSDLLKYVRIRKIINLLDNSNALWFANILLKNIFDKFYKIKEKKSFVSIDELNKIDIEEDNLNKIFEDREYLDKTVNRYIDEFYTKHSKLDPSKTIHAIQITALIIALKYSVDLNVLNRDLEKKIYYQNNASRPSDLKKILFKMELAFLDGLDWQIAVLPEPAIKVDERDIRADGS